MCHVSYKPPSLQNFSFSVHITGAKGAASGAGAGNLSAVIPEMDEQRAQKYFNACSKSSYSKIMSYFHLLLVFV